MRYHLFITREGLERWWRVDREKDWIQIRITTPAPRLLADFTPSLADVTTRAFRRHEWHMGPVYLEDLLTTDEAITKIEPTRKLLLDLALLSIDGPDAKAAREVLRDAVHERDWHDRRAWQHVLTMKGRLPFDDYGGVDTETLREELFARRYADADIPLAIAGAILFGAWSPKMWPLICEHVVNHIQANVGELRDGFRDGYEAVYSHQGFEGMSRGTRFRRG